jgi:CBS domain-containing protein
MTTSFNEYEEIRKLRELTIKKVVSNHFELNKLHDQLMYEVVQIALKKVKKEWGDPPSPFSFFVMGSAGRFEQALWSDQDHGIVYESKSNAAQDYFLELGKEISEGLYHVGYELCDGNVMASNPLWCKSFEEWQIQLENWVREESWESIRHLLIFIDSRVLVGKGQYIKELKEYIHFQVKESPFLLKRMLKNTMHVKKGVGVFGQILVETHGIHTGDVNLKETAFFPYVNAVRLLALKEKKSLTSTLSRINALSESNMSSLEREGYRKEFMKLLQFRLVQGERNDYDAIHYVNINDLSKGQKKELKEILKKGVQLYNYTKRLIEKGC